MVLEKALGQLGPRTTEYILEIVDEAIDAFAPAGREDQLVLRLAREVPLRVTEGLLGMDERYAAGVGQRIPELLDETQYAQRASGNLDRLLLQLVTEKRWSPGPDLVSWMIHYGPDLTTGEIAQQARVLLLGGVASGSTLISHSLYTQLPSPGPRIAMPDPADQPFLLWDAGEHTYPESARDLTALIVKTSVERLVSRLPSIRLPMPSRELLWTPVRGISCPQSLPVVFTPDKKPVITGPVRWLPDPIFTMTPPPRPFLRQY